MVGAMLAAFGVTIGAFGAHGLESWVEENIEDMGERVRRLDNWQTGARYQMYHAFGLIMIGVAYPRLLPKVANRAAWFMVLGIAIFSGGLYVLVLTGSNILGAFVPLGGVCFLFGWVLFAVAAGRLPEYSMKAGKDV